MSKEKEKKVGVLIPKSLWEKLDVIAKKQYRSTSALGRKVLSEYVEGRSND
tara:strand:+ start:158 stop:310 length:153 start_codon:yes stop_codon:yes gene_type:complete